MNKYFFLLLVFFSFSTLYAQKSTLVWSMSGSDLESKSYIVATVAIKDSTFLNYPPSLWKSIDKSKTFVNSFSAEYEGIPFANFNQDLVDIPSVFMAKKASEQNIPSIDYPSLEGGLVLKSTSKSKLDEFAFREAFLSADFAALQESFLKNEALTPSILQSIQSDLNYTLVSDLVSIARDQRAFFPVDLIHFFGEKNIIRLLRDRGYTITPLYTKFYSAHAKKIEEQKTALAVYQEQIQARQIPQNQTELPKNVSDELNSTDKQTDSILIEEQAKKSVDLNLPIGILNLSQWSNYSLKDSLFTYSAPARLKQTESQGEYLAKLNNLVYQVEMLEKSESLDNSIERLMIRKGGQLTRKEPMKLFGFPAANVEFIYNENKISRHLVIQHFDQLIICTVIGHHPEIFSQQASQFLESIELKPYVESVSNEIEAAVPSNEINTWVFKSFNQFSCTLPIEPTDVSTKLENESNLSAYVVPRGKVDDNTYLFVSFKKQGQDIFRLFNEAINTASKESSSIIIDRDVLPEGKNYYAQYLLKDALEQYYSIRYWYDGETFYQFIVKGNKRSITNQNAVQVLNSISIVNLF